MSAYMKSVGVFLTCLAVSVLVSITTVAADEGHPSIAGGVPFFYYSDLQAAADWYRNVLGLKPVTEEDWVVIFELTADSYIGLVNATGGALKPIEDKGALLSIDTAELEAWWDKVKDVEGIEIKNGIITGADGMIEQFSLYDPGGYIVEFFRWKEHRPEAQRYPK